MEKSHNPSQILAILHLSGRLDSFTSPNLKNQIDNEISTGKIDFIINLSQLSYISSSGLMVLLNAQKACNENAGYFYLVEVPDLIMNAFELSGFRKIFLFCKDVDEALELWRQQRNGY